MNNLYFETIKCFDSQAFNLIYHEKRIARTVGLNIDLNEYIYPPNDELIKCKVIYNDEGILDISYTPYHIREIKSFKLIYDDDIEYKYKSINRDKLDELFEKRGIADEIIIIKNGFVTDTSIANIAVFDGENWLTPKETLLDGTTRARLIDEKFLTPKDITVEDLKNTKKFAIMNAMIGFRIIENFDIIV